MPEVIGHGQGAAASQITSEQQGAEYIAHRTDWRPQQVWTRLTLVHEAGFAEENIGAEHTGHQRTDNQQRRRASPGDKVVVEFLNPATGVIADRNVNNEANQYCAGIDVHFYLSFF